MDEVGFALDLLLCLLPRCRSVFCGFDVAVDLSLFAASDGASVTSMACSRAGRQATASRTSSAAYRSCSISHTLCFGMSETMIVLNME